MPGITFSRSTGVRIANAVRKIERLPGGEEDLQRRRAGGLGRSTLWEVTAVQTGPGTVTIKRVSNISFDLNDASEKTDILYDPDNEPTVGDRGLLIRLGEGNLFFFKRDVSAVDHVIVRFVQYAYIKPGAADSNFGYPDLALMLHNGVEGATSYGIVKLERVPNILTDPHFSHIMLGWVDFFNINVKDGFVIYRLDVDKITQDFDTSTITWNIFNGLSKTNLLSEKRITVQSGGTGVGAYASNENDVAITKNGEGGINDYNFNLYGAYGLAFHWTHAAATADSWDADLRLKRSPDTPFASTNCGFIGDLNFVP